MSAPRSMTCHFESKPRSDRAGARFVAQSCRRCLVAKRIRIITAPPAIIGSGGDCAGGSGRAVICASMHSPVYSCNAHWHKRPSYSGVGFSAGRDLRGEYSGGLRQKCHAGLKCSLAGRVLARSSGDATAILADRRYAANGLTGTIAMMSCVLRNDRLFGLAPLDWSVLLGGSMLCGLLTLLF